MFWARLCYFVQFLEITWTTNEIERTKTHQIKMENEKLKKKNWSEKQFKLWKNLWVLKCRWVQFNSENKDGNFGHGLNKRSLVHSFRVLSNHRVFQKLFVFAKTQTPSQTPPLEMYYPLDKCVTSWNTSDSKLCKTLVNCSKLFAIMCLKCMRNVFGIRYIGFGSVLALTLAWMLSNSLFKTNHLKTPEKQHFVLLSSWCERNQKKKQKFKTKIEKWIPKTPNTHTQFGRSIHSALGMI